MQPLWDYARALYANPEVQTKLLALQDRFRLDVDLILWALWCHRQGLRLSNEEATEIIRSVEPMAAHATQPLREVRRYLSTPRKGFPETDQQALRQRVLELEIASEELVLKRLEAATRAVTHQASDLSHQATSAEQLFSIVRSSIDMPTVIADEGGPFCPLGLFRDLLKLAEDHGP